MQRKISDKFSVLKTKIPFIEIKKEWSCDKTQSDGQVSKGAKCSLTCNNGYRLSNLIIVFRLSYSYFRSKNLYPEVSKRW